MKATIDPVRVKERVDLVELSGGYTALRRESREEWSGPCPRCGGRDRFHVQRGWFFCRRCHPKRGDAIDFVQWVGEASGFVEACAFLEGGAAPARSGSRPGRPRLDGGRGERRPGPGWRRRAAKLAARAQERLWGAEGAPAREYLERRGLAPETWLAFRLGYEPRAPVPGTMGKERAPALVIPWYARAGRELVGVRRRFLEGEVKAGSLYGSHFQGRLYGGHVLDDFAFRATPEEPGALAQRTLVICEGELNAASIWQVARETRLDVVSLGSESQRLPARFAAWAGCYGTVFVWLDRSELARKAALQLPGAHALSSPQGMDANDLLREGALGGFLARVRLEACGEDEARQEALLWDLWDAADGLLGVDQGTAAVVQELAERLGRPVRLRELEPGRWIALRANA